MPKNETVSFFAQWAVFAGISAVMIIASWCVVSLKNIVHAALCLAVTLVGVAGIYIFLHAEFLAAVQILVYVGGVIVLVLFAVLLTQRLSGHAIRLSNEQAPAAFFVCASFMVGMLYVLRKAEFHQSFVKPASSVTETGKQLLTTYVLPFEVASVLLIAAMIGAIYFIQKENPGEKEQ